MFSKILYLIIILGGFFSGMVLAQTFFSPLIPETPVPSLPPPAVTTCPQTGTWPDCVTTNTSPTASSSRPRPQPANFAATTTITLGGTVIFTDGLSITLTTINDSRCQKDVQCIWAGELTATLELTGGDLKQTVLTRELGSVRTPSFTIDDYTFSLVEAKINEIVFTSTKHETITKIPVPAKATLSGTIHTKPNQSPAAASPDRDFATEVIQQIEKATTEFRQAESLPEFTHDNNLAKSASAYSLQMRTGHFFSHVNPQGCNLTCRFTQAGYSALSWGENLAMLEFTERPSAAQVAADFMTKWEKSVSHRENLLSTQFTNQGIGVSFDDTGIYVVAHFAVPR